MDIFHSLVLLPNHDLDRRAPFTNSHGLRVCKIGKCKLDSGMEEPLEAQVLRADADKVSARCPVAMCTAIHTYPCVPEIGILPALCEVVFASASARPLLRFVYPDEYNSLLKGTQPRIFEVSSDRTAVQTATRDVGQGEREPWLNSHPYEDKIQVVPQFERLHIDEISLRKKRQLDAACIENDRDKIKACLSREINPPGLVNMRPDMKSDSPILHICCRHGYTDIVTLLLENGADPLLLDTFDDNALAAAMHARQWAIAIDLIRCRPILLAQTGTCARSVALTIHQNIAIAGPDCTNVELLYELLQICSEQSQRDNETWRQASLCRVMRDKDRPCFEQDRFQDLLQADLECSEFRIHNPRKTVALLCRDPFISSTFSMSGWSRQDRSILDQAVWHEKVVRLGAIVGHEFEAHGYDRKHHTSKSGSYYASHAEKQLLAYYIWKHTFALDESCSISSGVLKRFQLLQNFCGVIYIIANKICSDCESFFWAVAKHFRLQYKQAMVRPLNDDKSLWQVLLQSPSLRYCLF